jgi:hypothetical protein
MKHSATTTLPRSESLDRTPVAVAVAVTAIALMAVMFYPFDQADDGGPRAILIVSALAIAITAVLFGPVAARASTDPDRATRAALVVASLAVLSAPLFWAGLPLVFGPAAAYLGHHARIVARSDRRRAQATVAIGTGALVWVLGVAAALLG